MAVTVHEAGSMYREAGLIEGFMRGVSLASRVERDRGFT